MIINISKILTLDVEYILTQFEKYNEQIMIVGGAVRDLIAFDKIDNCDIDFATTAKPNKIKEIFKNSKQFVIITVGEKFGSISLLSKQDNKIYEITALRHDFNTDGRHADVDFNATFEEDSKRRDFTINGLYLDKNGKIYDFNSGLDDLKNKKVKFIGNPEIRITEDYLRIMRFFRFSAKFATNIDENGFLACKNLAFNIVKISKERFTSELIGVIKGFFGKEMLLKMEEINLFNYWFNCDIKIYLSYNFSNLEKDQIIALLFNKQNILKKLDLTKNETKFIEFCWINNIVLYKEIDRNIKLLALSCNKIILEKALKINYFLSQEDKNFLLNIPKLPINGNDLLNLSIEPNKIGDLLKKANEKWVDNNFNIDKNDLLL